MHQVPLHFAPLVRGGGTGVPVIPSFTGEYRIDADSATASVQVWIEDADPQEMACIRNPGGPGCRATSGPRSARSVIIIGLAIPFIMLVDALFRH